MSTDSSSSSLLSSSSSPSSSSPSSSPPNPPRWLLRLAESVWVDLNEIKEPATLRIQFKEGVSAFTFNLLRENKLELKTARGQIIYANYNEGYSFQLIYEGATTPSVATTFNPTCVSQKAFVELCEASKEIAFLDTLSKARKEEET